MSWGQHFSDVKSNISVITSDQGYMPHYVNYNFDSLNFEDDEYFEATDGIKMDDTSLKDVLSNLKPQKLMRNPIAIVPRGLRNRDNKCFLNTVLQSLINCHPFCNFLSELDNDQISIPYQTYPILRRFLELYRQFEKSEEQDKTRFLRTGDPFTPAFFYNTLLHFNPISSGWQEDAQEYLNYLLDLLHGEYLKVLSKQEIVMNQNEQWKRKEKKKNVTIITEKNNYSTSIISNIFGGSIQSIVTKSRSKLQPTAHNQPFYCLQLDINKSIIQSVEDALDSLTTKYSISGFIGENGYEIPAEKRETLETLPTVLILHLKRFNVDPETLNPFKISKSIEFSPELEIRPTWVTDRRLSQRRYKLFSVISHWGKSTQGGHYTCDTYHSVNRHWLRFDDDKITKISLKDVLVYNSRDAYLLFYQQVE